MIRTLCMLAIIAAVATAQTPNANGVSTDDAGPVVGCYPKCSYIFCNLRFSFFLPTGDEGAKRYGGDNVVFTGDICTKSGNRLGLISDAYEAELYNDGKFTPISQWNPEGLTQRFSPTFFKPLLLRTAKYHNNGQKTYVNTGSSGIARETYQGNQAEVIKKSNQCVVVPFKHWQTLDGKYVGENSVVDAKNYRDCVSFTTL